MKKQSNSKKKYIIASQWIFKLNDAPKFKLFKVGLKKPLKNILTVFWRLYY